MNLESVVPPTDLQTTLNAIPGNHVILLPDAPNFTIIGATDSFLQTSYTTREQLIGKPLFKVFSDDTTNENATGVINLLASLNFVIDQKETHQMPNQRFDIINPHTGEFEFKVWAASNKPVLDAAGNIQCIIHTTEDITEKVRLQKENILREEQLNESERRFRHMVEQAPVPILLSRGEDVVIESLNAPMLNAMNKTSFDEVLGKRIVEVLPELKDQEVLQIVKDVQKTGVPFKGNEVPTDVFINNKLQRFYFNYSYTPIIEAGIITGVLHVALDITQQVAARQKIEQAKEELQFVTDTMPQLVWATEANGYSYFFNKGWLVYTGLTLEDVQGDGWMQSVHPDDLERTQDAWTHAFKDGAVYEIEYRLRRFDGAYRWFLTRGTPMKNEQGQIVKWYGSSTDIHEQKTSAEALKESTERFDLVSKATLDVIWDWDLKTDLIWWNEGLKTIYGYTEEEIEPTIVSWYNRVHPEDKERVIGGVHQVIDNGGNHWAGEYRFRRKDGSYATVFDRGYALHDKDGKPFRMIGAMQDITERKLTEEALRESEERFRFMVNTVPQSIWITDAEGRTEFLNKHWCDYCGEPYSETTAADIALKYLHPEDGPKVMQAFGEAMQTGEPFEVEQRNRSKEGEYRWFLNRATPYKDPNTGRVLKWFGVGIDIHDRKLAEQALQRSEEELEKKVTERTLELEKANQELKRSNKNLEEFAYAASHDLKEPTRKIHVFSDRLKDSLGDRLTEAERHYFQRMELASKRMTTLIDDLLTYSEISQKATLEQEVDLNFIIDCVLSDLDLEVEQKEATVQVSKLFTIKGHRRQLQQAFQNLISNALKYSKPDVPPVITIGCSKVKGGDTGLHLTVDAQTKDFYQVTVKDNGIGFEQADADRIFNVFTRLHGMAEYKGTGVGLSIVRKVVENHKGFIWAESQPGEGAIFKILLPVE